MLAIGNYVRAKSLDEAVALLAAEPASRILAGGTDLLVAIREGRLEAGTVVDLKAIPGLRGIRGERGDGRDDGRGLGEDDAGPLPGRAPSSDLRVLSIGPLTTISEIKASPAVLAAAPILVRAASVLGSWQVRNRATVGGNLCNASPAADMACPLLVLDATLEIHCSSGSRSLPLDEFFEGPGQTALKHDEVLAGITCATGPGGGAALGTAYIKLGTRKAMDIAVISAAVVLGLRGNRVTHARVALGSAAPAPIRAREAEAVLEGREPTGPVIDEAARVAQAATHPISDIRASAWYRSEMAREITARAITRALEEATGRE